MKIRRILAILLIIVTFSNITAYAAENENVVEASAEMSSSEVSSSSEASSSTEVSSSSEVSSNETATVASSIATSDAQSSESSIASGDATVSVESSTVTNDVAVPVESSAATGDATVSAELSATSNDATLSEQQPAETELALGAGDAITTAGEIAEETVEETDAEKSVSESNTVEGQNDEESVTVLAASDIIETVSENSVSEPVAEMLDEATVTIVSAGIEDEDILNNAGIAMVGASAGEDSPTISGGTNYSVDVNSIKFERVNNHDYQANEDINCSLRFQFTNTSTNELQECFITGIQIKQSDVDTICDQINNKVSGTYYNDILQYAKDIASCYVAESYYSITNKKSDGKTSEWFDLIDAEKFSTEKGDDTKAGYIEDGQNYGDTLLCWAAASSNAITYTGWAEDSDAGNEDAVLTDFEKGFFDYGNGSGYGVQWYTGGVNRLQKVDEEGNAYLVKRQDFAGAQERGVNNEFSGGVKKTDYAATNICTACLYEPTVGRTDYNVVADYLDNGDGLALAYNQYYKGVSYGGHAVTIFGYIKNIVESGVSAVKAFFMADSDTDIAHNTELNHSDTVNYDQIKFPTVKTGTENKSPEEERSELINKYTLHYISDYTNPDGTETIKLDSKNYLCMLGLDCSVIVIDLVRSVNNVKANFEPETEGTGNAVTTADAVFDKIVVPETTQVLDDVTVSLDLFNFSYSKLETTENKLTIRYTVDVYDDDNKLIGTSDREYSFNKNSIAALGTEQINTSIYFSTTGNYYVGASIKEVGYYDSNNMWHSIQEAYTTNNTLLKEYRRLIKVNSRPFKSSEAKSNSVSVSTNYYDVRNGNPIAFTIKYPEVTDVKELKVITIDGVKITDDDYEITKSEDGNIVITFKPEFLKKLSGGQHKFYLRWKSEYLRRFDIFVM